MKSTITMFVAIGLLLIAGCVGQSKNVPPSPGSIGTPIGQATGVYTGFANGDQYIFLSSDPVQISAGGSSDLNVSVNDGFIWVDGYYLSKSSCTDPSDKSTCQWKKFNFNGIKVSGSNWIENKATITLKINESEFFEKENLILAYTCRTTSTGFDCNGNQWLIKSFDVQVPVSVVAVQDNTSVGTGLIPTGIPTYQQKGDFTENSRAYIEVAGKRYLVEVGNFGSIINVMLHFNNTFNEVSPSMANVQEPPTTAGSYLYRIDLDALGAVIEVASGSLTDNKINLGINTLIPPPSFSFACTGDTQEYIAQGETREFDFDGDGNVDSSLKLFNVNLGTQTATYLLDGFTLTLSSGQEGNSSKGVKIVQEIVQDLSGIPNGKLLAGYCLTKP